MGRFVSKGGWWVVGQGAVFTAVAAGLWFDGTSSPGPLSLGIGALTALGGLALSGDAVARLRGHLSAFPAPPEGAPLVESGSFGLVRHPIYGGLVLAATGLALSRASWAGGVGALGLAWFFVLKSRHEEEMLESAYPAYFQYRHRVRRRLLPFLL